MKEFAKKYKIPKYYKLNKVNLISSLLSDTPSLKDTLNPRKPSTSSASNGTAKTWTYKPRKHDMYECIMERVDMKSGNVTSFKSLF